MKDSAIYMMSEGLFGNLCSMDILFLLFHRAQAKPANTNSINLIGRGPLPSSQVSERSFTECGWVFQQKISFMKPHTILAKQHPKKMWSTDSLPSPRQQSISPFQPLLTKLAAHWSLLLKICHKKNLISREPYYISKWFQPPYLQPPHQTKIYTGIS